MRFELIRVTAVSHLHDHVLWLEFSDGLAGEVDLSADLKGPVFESLRDTRQFERVRLGTDTVEWPNGADWSPENLHARVVAAQGLSLEENDDGDAGAESHSAPMPELSRFFGIVISMFYDDHARPHFHARCGGESIAIEIDGDGMRGAFPSNRLPLLFAWRDLHREELRANWQRMRNGESPFAIAPLE
jgi:hypothetical protein